MSMHCIQDDRWNQFQKIKIKTAFCLLVKLWFARKLGNPEP
jgi:hypothetical protein